MTCERLKADSDHLAFVFDWTRCSLRLGIQKPQNVSGCQRKKPLSPSRKVFACAFTALTNTLTHADRSSVWDKFVVHHSLNKTELVSWSKICLVPVIILRYSQTSIYCCLCWMRWLSHFKLWVCRKITTGLTNHHSAISQEGILYIHFSLFRVGYSTI